MHGPLDLLKAEQFFEEADRLFDRDGGRLWGVSLEGPMLLVDLETRHAVANQADARAALALQGNVWAGRIPEDVVVANTAMTWSGVHWTVLLWQSIPDEPRRRARFMAHEAFHRVQEHIGLPWPALPHANRHLDSLAGRYWLQLEWRALAHALQPDEPSQRDAVADALCFRSARRSLFPNAATEEGAMELHEGLAEYTGFSISQSPVEMAIEQLQSAPERYPSFVRSFAYASGPAYGLLLDAAKPGWPRDLRPGDDLGALLQQALTIADPATPYHDRASHITERYGGRALWEAEEERQRRRAKEIADYRERLLEGPALILPISKDVQCAFDPRATVPIDTSGTVFPFVEIRDAWGGLTVKRGGLWMAEDWTHARIPAPVDGATPCLESDAWRLELNEDWEIVRQANGNWLLTPRTS
ncbi:MAG TPA: hypothetical protein ENN96_01450, partial [Candidatus Acetothermia bacterium]|nr:hypothetical protein [Candidatus Acetothermia bacterium]